ncbi:MAG: hypothetical protein K8R60_07390 [Burkholderiales bacterium]|nr:hypothetical protein [Burkholderiales bacterium]
MRPVLILSAVAGVVFVWLSGEALPEVVASHFSASGAASGFMSRGAYLESMLALVVVLPFVVALSGRLASLLPPRFVNLPNKAYWLAPERQAATLHTLSQRTGWLAVFLLAFLCFVHWLVVQANIGSTKALPQVPFFIGLALLLVGTLGWAIALHRRFGNVP